MTKRLFSLLLCLVLLLSACGQPAAPAPGTSGPSEPASAPVSEPAPEESAPEEIYAEPLRLAALFEQRCGGRDYDGEGTLRGYVVDYLAAENALEQNRDDYAYVITEGEFFEVAKVITEGVGPEPENPEEEEHWSVEHPDCWLDVQLAVEEFIDENGTLVMKLSRTLSNGTPLRKVRYTFRRDTAPENLPKLLVGVLTPGEEYWRIVKVENLDVPEFKPDILEITTPGQLADFAKRVNSGDPAARYAAVSLKADLDMTGIEMEPIGLFDAIRGSYDHREGLGAGFSGTFRGNGHTISNLSIDVRGLDVTDYSFGAGLFALIDVTGSVYDLTLRDSSVIAETDTIVYVDKENPAPERIRQAGAMAGCITGLVQNCHVVDCTVTAYGPVGGFAAAINIGTDIHQYSQDGDGGQVIGCSVSGVDVTGSSEAGVFVGSAHYGRALRCAASGSVTAVGSNAGETAGAIGGFVGFTVGGRFDDCVTEGQVYTMVHTSWLGNFLGYNQGTVSNCWVSEKNAWWSEDIDVHYPNSVADVKRIPASEFLPKREELLSKP